MEKIKSLLKEIEKNKEIEILFACETGSRAWGFPSPDSDYDIRFIYKHKLDWYLSLSDRKDTIEMMLDNGTLDVNGWDIKKSLQLLAKSNAALVERFTSPIVYYEATNFKSEYLKVIDKNYNNIAVFYHHYSLAKKFWDEIKISDEVKLKALFYLIRSLLSCKYLIENKCIAPMQISGLLVNVDRHFEARILELINLKKTVNEKYLFALDDFLKDWIVTTFKYAEANKENIKASKNDFNAVDNFFKKVLYDKYK